MQIIKVYGPYSRKEDRRKVVVLRLADGKLTTKSYARFLYEQEHGLIPKDLEVDHINDREWEDDLSNFQLLTKAENIRKSAKKAKIYEGVCFICNNSFTKPMNYVKGNQVKQNKAGPFCSKRCAGLYSTNTKEIQIICAPIITIE